MIRDDQGWLGKITIYRGGGDTRVYCNQSNILLHNACSHIYVPIVCVFRIVYIHNYPTAKTVTFKIASS
jgi:hypothetical protein